MIKLSGNDLTFGKNTVSQSGQRMITKSGIREKVLSGKRVTGFHWNGHRFPPPTSGSVLYMPGYPAQGSTILDYSSDYVLHFTGSATSNVNCGAIHNASAKLWVSFWFRLDSAFSSASGTAQYLFGKRLSAQDRLVCYLLHTTGRLSFVKEAGDVILFTISSAETSWVADTWYHVIVSISDVAGARMIIDGGAAVTDADATAAPNGGDFVIGDRDDPGGGDGIIGEMKEVVCGTDDLSAPEEAALYAGTLPGDEDNYWKLDEGTGTTAYDTAGSDDGTIDSAPSWEGNGLPGGNDGTIVGASWYQLPTGLWYLDYDGSDDKVAVSDGASIQNLFDGGGTYEVWVNIDSDG
ncbi:hypothetical protein LCGC14_2310890, partial [marine sediment metagenome]